MAESTQIIVRRYFEPVEGYFLQENVKFKVPGNYSDIDLIGINSKGEGLLVEVKSWATENTTMSKAKGPVDWLVHEETTKAAREILGGIVNIRRVFVVAYLGKEDGPMLLEYAKRPGINVEIITLDVIIRKLFEKLNPQPNYDDEELQLLRLLKRYSDPSSSDPPTVRLEFLQ